MATYGRIAFALLLLWPGMVHGQPVVKPPPAPGKASANKKAEDTAPAISLERLTTELARQRKQLEALRSKNARYQDRLDKLERRLNDAEDAVEDPHAAGAFKPGVRIYGFFDVSLIHNQFAGDSVINVLIHPGTSFALTTANLYLASNITRQLSTLMELRISYLPIGSPSEIEILLETGDQQTPVPGTRAARANTTVINPVNSGVLRQGGIYMERIHLTYAFCDWFKVIAGRFITPFGIWNVDHGSPVVIPATLPYLQVRQIVPLAQTGVQIFGRLFPLDTLFLDYAFTASNGRGPFDEVYDIDQNKGLGARLKLRYEAGPFKAELGAYGYFGRYTDKKVSMVVNLQTGNFGSQTTRTVDYDEAILALDMRASFHGLLLQSEYVSRHVSFNKPLPASALFPIFGTTGLFSEGLGLPGLDAGVQADFISQDAYVLLAYTLPLQRWLTSVQLTPFVFYEINKMDDAQKADHLLMIGLNTRLGGNVVVKAQWGRFDSDLTGLLESYVLQTAVSF